MSESDGITAVAHIPFRDLVALRDASEALREEIWMAELAEPGELELMATQLADQLAQLVADVEITGGAHG